MNKKSLIVFILSIFCAAKTSVAAPDQYSFFSCYQHCGLTENATATVSFSSLSEYESKSALYDLCTNQQLRLQGEAKCSETKYDSSKNERFQRCKNGVSPLGSCFVSVHGYGDQDRYFQTFQAMSNVSFDDAERQALEKCRNSLSRCSHYACSVAAYTAY